MANILPYSSQKKMSKLSRAQFVIVTSSVLSLASLIVYGALLPSYLVLYLNPGSVVAANNISHDQITSEKAALSHSQSLLNTFAPAVSSVTPTDAIRTALALQPPGIHIDHISYSAGKNGKLILQGAMDTTDAINKFRTALLSSKKFTSVDVPVGVLVGSEDGRFDVTLLGAF